MNFRGGNLPPGLTNRCIIMPGFTNRYIIMTGGKRASDTGHKAL